MALSVGSAVSRFKVSDGNLGLLQEYLRRDPESYRDEFMEQFQHFLQFVNLLELEPKLHRSSVEQLLEVVNFLTAVAFCYPEQSKIFGSKLVELLTAKAEELGHELRLAFCRALIALRNAHRMTAMDVLPVLFHLLKCDDKQLRKFIKAAVLSIIKHTKIASKSQKRKSRRARKVCQLAGSGGGGGATRRGGGATSLSAESAKIQAFVFAHLRDSSATSARIAQNILVHAYRKGFWRDAKTANVLAECVFHKVQRVQVSTMRFFLGSVEDEEGDEGANESDSENESRKDSASVLREVVSSLKYGKKTKKREKDLDKAKREMGKSRKSKRENRAKFCNLEALSTIYDPQKFVDRLFGCLESKKNEKFAVRLLQIALCARLIGLHHLQTLGFYSYLHRYLQPKQREVTRILLYAAQSCHELVPPDLVENLVRRIAQNFISDQNTPEAITVGLNTIREIFSTCPAAATEELLRDLTEYKSYKNKNVSMAARALITLFRSVNPKLLRHKDRGRPTDDDETLGAAAATKPSEFGALTATDFVPGAEVLSADAPEPEPENAGRRKKAGKRGRRAESGGEDSDDEWVDVVSSEDELNDENDYDAENSAEMAETDGVEEEHGDEENEEEESDDDDSGGEWVTDSENDEEDAGSEGDDDDDGWETCSDEGDEAMADESMSSDVRSGKSSKKKAVEKKKVTFKLGKVEKKKTRMLEKAEAKRQALEKAKLVSESRILTDSDFRAIRVHQIRRQMAAEKRANNAAQRRTNDEVLLDEEIQEKLARRETGAGDGLPRLNDIEHFHKKLHRQNKAERLAQAEIHRDEHESFGRPKKNGPHVGRTNRELAKRKNFQMVKQKMRGKNRQRSFRDRQIGLRNYLQKQAGKKVI